MTDTTDEDGLPNRFAPIFTIPLPPEVEPYREELRRFIHAMVYKLKVHSHKGKWEGLNLDTTLALLRKEGQELEEAIAGGNLLEIITEAADVANFALIAASIAVERGK